MQPIKKKKCRHCRKLFRPDSRNATHQKYCRDPECRKASKANSQKQWLKKPENLNYFRGPVHVQRVQQWRKTHPGYWRRKSKIEQDALQETIHTKPIENNTDRAKSASGALQDILNAQPIVLLGLIANFTGSRLQDDIAITVRRLLQLGQDVVNDCIYAKGGHYDLKTAHLSPTGPAGTHTVQLDRSPAGP